MSVNIKKPFERTRVAGSIAAGALDEVAKIIKPGITTNEIDKLYVMNILMITVRISAPLFYRGFPNHVVHLSNHIVCHGIPSEKILKDGDILNVDVTAYKDGWHGDTSRMFEVGRSLYQSHKN